MIELDCTFFFFSFFIQPASCPPSLSPNGSTYSPGMRALLNCGKEEIVHFRETALRRAPAGFFGEGGDAGE